MCNVIWRVVIRLLFSRGSLSWFVLVLSKEFIRSSDEDRNTADMSALQLDRRDQLVNSEQLLLA